jgi:SAM-dependent methyltransferase
MIETEYEIMHRLEGSHWWFLTKKKYIQTILDQSVGNKKGLVLDIGCGTGGMLDVLKAYGRVYGMDRHQAACRFSRRQENFPLVRGDANTLPFKKERFQLITLLDVLYHQHIARDEEVLSQVHDLLGPDGLLLITDSAFEFLKSTHDLAVMARHRYTLKELNAKLRACHFTIQRCTYLYFMIFPAVVLSRLAGKISLAFSKPVIRSDLKETNPLINRFLTTLLGWEGRLLRRVNLPWGSTLLILAKKA